MSDLFSFGHSFLDSKWAGNFIALCQLGLGIVGLLGIAFTLIQVAELRRQRLSVETLSVFQNLDTALVGWRRERLREDVNQQTLQHEVSSIMGLYEVFSGLINRGSLPRGAKSFALNHMKGILVGFCSDAYASIAIGDIAQDDNVYDEIRFCILSRPKFFDLYSDACLQSVMFPNSRPSLYEDSWRGKLYRSYHRLRLKRRLDV